jgi:DNA (cytosine-5)-methyltransferase 1
MKFIELFSGIGGMGYGLMQAGFECVGFCEIDKYAHDSYNILHNKNKKMWEGYDVNNVTDDDIRGIQRESGEITIIAGGFPCQSFSIAGNRRGFEDTRGTLVYQIFRFASILKPKILLLENVKGLLNHDKGRTFGTILSTMDELGYDAEWQVLNSKNFDVPQNRERVFIIGYLRGTSRRKVFPFTKENTNISRYIGSMKENKNFMSVYGVLDKEGLSTTLLTMQGGNRQPKIIVLGNTSNTGHLSQDVHSIEGISPTIASRDYKGAKQIMVKQATKLGYDIAQEGDSINISQPNSKTRRGRVGKGLANTLQTKCNQVTLIGNRIRKITPLECFRLQSFPDEWYYELKEKGISNSQLYKLAGNAVTSNVVFEIGNKLRSILKNENMQSLKL